MFINKFSDVWRKMVPMVNVADNVARDTVDVGGCPVRIVRPGQARERGQAG